ncbi:Nn.00g079230.m01.CDS01 [Neocucurbitaria sp. VM-36]
MAIWQRFSFLFPLLKTPRPETEVCNDANSEEQWQSGLATLCRLPAAQPDQTVQQVSDERVQAVSNILFLLDAKAKREDGHLWSYRPRTYIILFNVGCVQLMNSFVEEGKTDIWLPYDDRTLPSFIQQADVRQKFLKIQKHLLTSARELEDISTHASLTKIFPHIHLEGSGDQHFRRINSLGQGNFGAVDEVYSCLSHNRYARKRVLRGRSTTNRRAQTYLVKELTDLKQLSHRHLVKLLGSYTDKEYIAFLMHPVAECNLYDFLTKPGGLSDRDPHDVRTFFGCLAGAVHYLHGCNIRHRDLSSRNILIQRGSVFISDFGSAYKWAANANQGSVTQDRHVPASLEYMAPEVAKRSPRSSSSDMWSLGVIFMEMTTLLVGRTLQELEEMIERNARLRGLEPYVWANPQVVNIWLDELQKFNCGPRHDNEPLDWIRDLLNELPNSRPKSHSLMQDILDSPSFNIFCCIRCKPEFSERHFENTDIQPIPENTFEDTTDMMQNIASYFEEKAEQPTVISSMKSSTIQTWLAETPWMPPQMPGGFDTAGDTDDVESSDGISHCETPDESVVRTYSVGFTTQMRRPSPSCINQVADIGYPQPPRIIEPSDPAYDIGIALDSQIDMSQKPLLNINPAFVRDTGLGFLEIDSPSSSDDGEMSSFKVIEDSSGSDSDSVVTIMPSHGDETKIRESYKSRPVANWILPTFEGEENSWIQTLDALPDEQENVNGDPHVVADNELVHGPASLSDRAQFIATAMSKPIGNDTEVSTADQLSEGNPIDFYAPPVPLLAVETIIADCNDEGTSRASENKHVVHPEASEIVVEDSPSDFPRSHPIMKDTLGSLLVKSSVKNDNLAMTSASPRDKIWTERLEVQEVSEVPKNDSNSCHKKNSSKKRSSHGVNEDGDSLVAPVSSLEELDCSEHVPINPDLGTVQPSQTFTSPLERPSSQAETLNGPAETQHDVEEPLLLPKARRRKPSTLKVTFADDPLPSSKPLHREGSTVIPGISPRDYIEDTWESASSVATSMMSERTSRILQSMSLNKWLDRDHRLIEVFCSKGNAQAVRVLLDKGCNPGKAAGSKQGRRVGPITIAIQGASLRHNKCVRELIKYGVDVNVVNRKSGKTPLHLAIENPYFTGYEHLIRTLIEAGANTNTPDLRGDHPIMKLFHGNDIGPLDDHHRKALALLLNDASTDVDVSLPGTLNTPLHLAVRRKDPFTVGMLLYKKANVNAKNASGSTPLLITARQFQTPMTKDQKDLLRLLLNTEGILVNEKAGVNEQTALHYAVKAGVVWAVEHLMKHGADPTCQDYKGRGALALADYHAKNWPPEDRDSIMLQLQGVREDVRSR